MIVKPRDSRELPTDLRQRAGVQAELDMAHHLHRAFATDREVCVLHDLRIVDAEQPEHDGRDGACQIDHLVLHCWGAFIVESKSVCELVTVRGDGSGGDEWTYRYDGRDHGMASPIQQARLQGEFLRTFLNRHREVLRGRVPFGMRTITKLLRGTDQCGFRNMPIQVFVAISAGGDINRVNGWTEPKEPFPTYVKKHDLVVAKIRQEIATHQSAYRLLGPSKGDYGVWSMSQDECGLVAEFLKEHHRPLKGELRGQNEARKRITPAPPSHPVRPSTQPSTTPSSTSPRSARGPEPRCKECGGADVVARWGPYGPYWNCTCGTNTAMSAICSKCGTEGHRGKSVRISRQGNDFTRVCTRCRFEEVVWKG